MLPRARAGASKEPVSAIEEKKEEKSLSNSPNGRSMNNLKAQKRRTVNCNISHSVITKIPKKKGSMYERLRPVAPFPLARENSNKFHRTSRPKLSLLTPKKSSQVRIPTSSAGTTASKSQKTAEKAEKAANADPSTLI